MRSISTKWVFKLIILTTNNLSKSIEGRNNITNARLGISLDNYDFIKKYFKHKH